MTGTEAAEIGVVSRALPAAEVLPAALEMAHDIAVNVAPVSAALSKRMLWDGITSGLDEMIAAEGKIIASMATSADAAEGVRAFFEKRSPNWSMTLADDLPRFQQ